MAESVIKLPFITSPKVETRVIGNDRTGTLEFPVYGDLTVNEAAWLTANSGGKTAFTYTSKLALKIAKLERVKPLDSHAFVAKVLATAMGTGGLTLDEKEQAWSVRYVRDLEECALHVLEASTRTQNALVTCVIRHRLPNMTDWLPEDTANLPSELCEEIFKFAIEERDRNEAGLTPEEAVQETEEMLGKYKTEVMTTLEAPTGEPSASSSESSTPETPTSGAKTSATRKPATSSKRSKKVASSDKPTTTI